MTTGWGGRPARRVPARKIHPPQPPAPHVPRERVRSRPLDEAVASRPVTLVSAPTGYGKTTFLTHWTSTASTRVAWLCLDELDNDPQTLWRGILASIEVTGLLTGGADGTMSLDDLWRPGTSVEPDTVDGLITLVDDSPEPLVLVLDDVDELRSDGARATLDRLLRYLPAQLRVVLSGRFDPPLALHRLRTSGDLTEFRAGDLQFTRNDVQTLADLSGVNLSEDDQRELHHVTGGWPVAVRMALLTAHENPAAPRPRRLLSPRGPVADLLVTDLLASLEPDLSRFVLRATTCHRVDAVLADALGGGPDGSHHLAECVDRGLFIEREPGQPDAPATYRWHDFFRAQCQARLAATDPSTWRSLHRTAAHHWHDRDLEEAVDHALSGGRPALAAQSISDHWIDLVLRGKHALLLALCLKIPPPFDESPDLLLLVAVCRYLEGKLAQADLQVRRARARATDAPPASDGGRFALLESLLRVVLAVDPPDLVEMARRGTDLLRPGTTSDDAATAGAEFVVGQLLARVEQPTAGVALLEASATIATSRRMTALRLACEAELALVASTEEGAGAGRARARRVLDEARTLGWDPTVLLSPAVLALARAAYESDDLEAARTLADEAASCTLPADRTLRARARVMLLEVALAAGDPAGAEALHDSIVEDDDLRHLPPSWPVVVSVLDARWARAHGEASGARRTVDSVAGTALLPQHPVSLVWCADLIRLDGDHERARSVLDRLPGSCRTSHVLVAHRLVGALLADSAHETDRAHSLLEESLALAEVDDVRRPFVDRSCQVLPLLRSHLSWGSLHAAYCVTLLDHLPDARPVAPLVPSFWSLTPREHEVLLFLRSPMTASDIADAVFVSVNTVKTHQRAIYRKLGVVGRREAVQVASERGLL